MDRKLIIAIDGVAGSGKSTLAKSLAKKLNYLYLDTGAMYRALTYLVLKSRTDLRNHKKIAEIASDMKLKMLERGKVFLNSQDVTKKIRAQDVSDNVSKISAVKQVRKIMVKRQRLIGNKGGVVLEGRDIGTVVFPNADIKFFLIASPKTRADRRYKELSQKRIKADIKHVEENIRERDLRDSTRKISPLKPAKDAIIIDTTKLSMQQKDKIAMSHIARI